MSQLDLLSPLVWGCSFAGDMVDFVAIDACAECQHRWERRWKRPDTCEHGRFCNLPCAECGR